MPTVEHLAKVLAGQRVGAGWMARCPGHDDTDPSLSIQIGRYGNVLVHCHAGCAQLHVIAALRALGLWGDQAERNHHTPKPFRPARLDVTDSARRETALSIWHASRPASGTVVQTYLVGRGLRIPVPAALRFHRRLRHPSGLAWPGMVALVTAGINATPQAVHRTFLACDGAGKAPVMPEKMMLGPCRGGVVRLGTPGDVLMVGEGIETCLSAMVATGHVAWAALSASGLRVLDLPPYARDVIVLADGNDVGDSAARACALRWSAEGRKVRLAHAPRGTDFNDLLLGTPRRPEREAS